MELNILSWYILSDVLNLQHESVKLILKCLYFWWPAAMQGNLCTEVGLKAMIFSLSRAGTHLWSQSVTKQQGRGLGKWATMASLFLLDCIQSVPVATMFFSFFLPGQMEGEEGWSIMATSLHLLRWKEREKRRARGNSMDGEKLDGWETEGAFWRLGWHC